MANNNGTGPLGMTPQVTNFSHNVSATIDGILRRDGFVALQTLNAMLSSCSMWSQDDIAMYRDKLPLILAHLFGLRQGSRMSQEEEQVVVELLSPVSGKLLAPAAVSAQTWYYMFPLQNLPEPTRRLIYSGDLKDIQPPRFAELVHRSLQLSLKSNKKEAVTDVQLRANEYFAFCFAYAAVKTDALAVDQQPIAADTETDLFDLIVAWFYKTKRNITSLPPSIYLKLLQGYLNYLLPLPRQVQTEHAAWNVRELQKRATTAFGGVLGNRGDDAMGATGGDAAAPGATALVDASLISILIHFYLHQNQLPQHVTPGTPPSALFVPPLDTSLMALQVLCRHVACAHYQSLLTGEDSILTRQALEQLVEPLYSFLALAFINYNAIMHRSSQCFLRLTAVWLAFLQPWKGMVFNPPTQGEIPANTFIVKHLKFYTTMMQHFLRAAQHLNFGTQEGIDTLDSVLDTFCSSMIIGRVRELLVCNQDQLENQIILALNKEFTRLDNTSLLNISEQLVKQQRRQAIMALLNKISNFFAVSAEDLQRLREEATVCSIAEREQDGRLEEASRQQVLSGLVKCSNVALRYRGPPETRPIASYENATLVRLLYKLECYLHRRGWFAYSLRSFASYYTHAVVLVVLPLVYLVAWLLWRMF